MTLNSTDLFVVQSQSNKELYKLSLNDLQATIEGGSGVNFRGSVDLKLTPAGQLNPDPPANGDLYLVNSDANAINNNWTMAGGVTSASENDRVIWDENDGQWILVTSGSSTGGTLVGIVATDPLEVDLISDPTTPVISIKGATTTTEGSVERLATAADVAEGNNTPSTTAVVTADLLRTTNKLLSDLSLAPGGVLSVSTDNTNLNSALEISPTTGAVKIDVKTASETAYGVVSLANAADLTNGTGGAGAVIDASMLKDVSDLIPEESDFGVLTITEGGTDIVSGALDIKNVDGDVTIGVKIDTFVPADFDSLPDINA
jgi:hypothetical protein